MFNGLDVEGIIRQKVYARFDGAPYLYLYDVKDFDGLNKKGFTFESSLGHNMQAYFYYYDNPIKNRLIIFEHGLWGCHRSYLKEIEMLCKRGYLVLAQDHTGCMESGGEDTNGFAQSLRDLNDLLNAVSKIDKLNDYDVSIIGHSWGAYSTMNITALYPKISHLVPISGFISVKAIIKQNFRGLLALLRKKVMKIEKRSNPDFFNFSGEKTLKATNAKVLVVHAVDDLTVEYDYSAKKLQKALKKKENVEFLIVENKGHNPNYTENAVTLKRAMQAEIKEHMLDGMLEDEEFCKEFLEKHDWDKITEQDNEVWNKIFDFLER